MRKPATAPSSLGIGGIDRVVRRRAPVLALLCLVLTATVGLAARGGASEAAARGAESVLPVGVPPSVGELSPERSERPEAGRFLVARRQVIGPFFSRSVVLLLQASSEGAMGLIINRPMDVQLSAVVPEMPVFQERGDKLWFGGPVSPDTLMLLVRASDSPPDSHRVLPDVYVTRNADTLRGLARSEAPQSRFHVYVGYAGWGPGQLDAELARGDWRVARARPELIFESRASEVWPELMRELDGVQVRAPLAPQKSPRVSRSSTARPRLLLYAPRRKTWSVDARPQFLPWHPRQLRIPSRFGPTPSAAPALARAARGPSSRVSRVARGDRSR